jgi:hypothetical protein
MKTPLPGCAATTGLRREQSFGPPKVQEPGKPERTSTN